MQRKFSLLLVLALSLSLIFCFGATALADDTGAETDPAEETALTAEEAAEEEAATDEAAEEEAAEEAAEEEAAEEAVFTDVPSDFWAYDYIMDIFERKLTTGTSATTFGPEANLTRAQFVTFLGRLAGVDAEEHAAHDSAFTDIGDANIAYAYGYICWAAEIGVTTGATATTFNPLGQLTREQMATMVKRFADYYGVELKNTAATISDADAVSAYAKDAVAALAPTFIALQDGKFNPLALATRAEMAQVLSLFPVPEAGFVAAPAADEPAADAPAADEEAADEEAADEEAADEEAADEEAADDEADDEEAAK